MQVHKPERFPPGEVHHLMPGEAGAIEVITHQAGDKPSRITAIVCHPHPLFGGTMQNKVVFTTTRALNRLGIDTLKFNFRGVGKSEGAHAHAAGEGDDLEVLASWVQSVKPKGELWLAGFSFGSYVAASRANLLGATRLISIAPPVHHFDFAEIVRPSCPWLVIQGDADEVVPPDDVFSWLETDPNIDTTVMKDAGHFFHGRLTELGKHIESWCESR